MQQDTVDPSNFLPHDCLYLNSVQHCWMVEYSPVIRDFYINKLDSAVEENREILLKGYKKEANIIGLFKDRETAETFANAFKEKLISTGRWYDHFSFSPNRPYFRQDLKFSDWFESYLCSKTPNSNKNDFALLDQASDEPLSFELISGLIRHEFARKPLGFIEQFCKENKLSLQETKSLLNNHEFSYDAVACVKHILLALDYKVRLSIVFSCEDKDAKDYAEEITYYFTK
jgi:hypothetical protein